MAGCYNGAEIHDTQCVLYQGPDPDHAGREICVSSSHDFSLDENPQVDITDVTDESAPINISRINYPDAGFAHQGWLTENHRFFLLGDELDELDFSVLTRTHVFDVSDLDAPVYLFAYEAATASIDHNLYVLGNRVFQANYTSGVRVLEFVNLSNMEIMEIASFDTFPDGAGASFDGAWSVYPFLPSGNIIASDTSNGLFILTLQ